MHLISAPCNPLISLTSIHGAKNLDFRTRRAGLESRANWCSLNGFTSGSVRDHSSAYHTRRSSRTAASRAGSSGWLVISALGADVRGKQVAFYFRPGRGTDGTVPLLTFGRPTGLR